MKNMILVCIAACFFIAHYGCEVSGAVDEMSIDNPNRKKIYVEEVLEVDTSRVQLGTFNKEILSNGKLKARKEGKLQFTLNEEIIEIRVKNGQRVRKGDTLAMLDGFTQYAKLKQATDNLDKAKIEMQDVLISFGYHQGDSLQIPTNIVKMARAKSGLSQAETEQEIAQHEYRQNWLLAPFSGVIANLEAKPHNSAEDYKPFCHLLDDSQLEVEFSVLESEIQFLKKNQSLKISPFSFQEKSYEGRVSEISPMVDENGMILIKAKLPNTNRKLMAGNNVKVVLQNAVPKQLIVPKSALVQRQGRQVVFTYKDGKAFWQYVSIKLENTSSYTISEGLEPHDIIIVLGNLNLADQAKVSPRPFNK